MQEMNFWFHIQVSIEQADGKPVISTVKDVEVVVYTKFYDASVKNFRARVLWTKMFAPPPTGVLVIDVSPPIKTESLHLKVILTLAVMVLVFYVTLTRYVSR